MGQIEFLVFLMFVFNMCILGVLAYATLRNKETYQKEIEDLKSEVERLKRNLTL